MTHFFRLFLSLFICLLSFSTISTAQFVNFESTWKEFLADPLTVDISEITQPSKDLKEDYAKYCLMFGTVAFCADEVEKAEKFMREIESTGDIIYNKIPGFKERYEKLTDNTKTYYKVENQWLNFLKYENVTLDDLEKLGAVKVCEKGTLAKYDYMKAHALYCKGDIAGAKANFENRVLKLAERTTLNIKDVNGLEPRVKNMKQLFIDLPPLAAAWKDYVDTDVSKGTDIELPLIECNPIPNMKEYMLRAAVDVCVYGAENLKKINNLKEGNTQPIPADLGKKIKWLESEVGRYNGDLVSLNKAWSEFVPSDTLKSNIEYMFEYCEKDAQIKAYTIYGTINACEKGNEMLDKIAQVQREFNPTLDNTTIDKIAKLEDKLENYHEDFLALEALWGTFVQNNDTLLEAYSLAGFYCDKIAQVKSWTIKGMMNECKKGQQYLNLIDDFQKKHNLQFDDELACRVLRLRQEIWDCRYWELILQARKETHAERERFGPASALIMEGDLNSDQQPCPTTVVYNPLGNIGIKYVITTFLCQEIDLAKMGDPEYYKKIASWVDNEVLQKYCEANMRCKEDFFIYLEGHTDGHEFKGARYKKSLDIPEGTPYTHFIGQDTLEKTTDRELTNSLRSNMELGIARAWTVKHQLDFMGVPITIGAYEHPSSEKGGEYRRIEIELNITNLLLDFYEKRLKELWVASGIGDRPENC